VGARAAACGRDVVERTAVGVCGVLFVLVLSRLWGVTMSREPSLDQERTLRLAGSAMARASTIDGVAAIVRKTVWDLIGRRPNWEAVFAVRDDGEPTVVATASGGLAPPSELAGLVPHWLPRLRLLESDEPRLVPVAGLDPREKAVATRAGFESLLLCPLVLASRPSGDPLIGVLAAFGEDQLLSGMSPALGILASQAAVALERIVLSEEVARQRGEALFRTLVQDALDVILVLDDDATIKYASPSATRLFGDVPIEGAKAGSLSADSERVTTRLVAGPATSGDAYSGLYQITRRDGQRLFVEVRYTDLRHDETVRGQVLTIRDVTEEHQLQDQLSYQAFHDPLTGLPNRSLFTDRAGHAVAVARRNKTTAAVLFVDLDDFKVINDTMGHAVGDELLAGVAGRLSAVARESDTAARLGGDEFALLIENLADPAAAGAFAGRVVAAFREPFGLSAGSVLAGATVGVATTADSFDADQLLRHADLSLYAAKSEGKRRWHRYAPALSAAMARRREMQAMLEDTLARSALTLAYQPIAELATGAVRGFEALVRWPHPARGTVPPEELIEVAEETGLIVPLGSWILRQAITDMASWRGTNPHPQQPCIIVKVLPRQFRDPGFIAGLRRCLDETGLPAPAVALELPESSLRPDERTTSDLAELKDLGIRLVIDDFATGSSHFSPTYLRELPIDALKLDKSYVDAITEPQGRKFAELIVDFADAIEVEVIAEGIETEEQRALLTEMGCRLGQGYLLAMHMNSHAAQVLLRSRRPLTGKA
jgi:diguanylate cyclase (GGDEF)-like protein/PAS domain S-box-containing protein